MNILGTRVKAVSGDIADAAAEARAVDFDLAPEEIKSDNAGLEKGEIVFSAGSDGTVYFYARTGEPGKDPDAAGVRAAVCNTLLALTEKACSSLALAPLGVASGFSLSVSAKITAQEIFRYIKTGKNNPLKSICCVIPSQYCLDDFKNSFSKYLDHMVNTLARGPYLTVDGIVEKDQGLVLIERKNPPFGWALPGGFVDYGESAEQAVKREVKEETDLNFRDISQFRVYSEPDRDPRFHTASVVFCGKGEGVLKAADDAVNAAVFSFDGLPENIAFDHRQIIEDYKKCKGLNSPKP